MDFSVAQKTLHGLLTAVGAWLPRAGIALVVVAVSGLFAKFLRWAVMRSLPVGHGRENLRVAIARVVFVAVIVVNILVGATIAFPTFTIGSLIQLLGFGGVVVGFAFKDIFQNFLAGLLVLFTNPFRVGDQIGIGKHRGTIEEIQTRATLLRTFDRQLVIIPNADLFTRTVRVSTAYAQRRMEYDLQLAPDANVDSARDALLKAL